MKTSSTNPAYSYANTLVTGNLKPMIISALGGVALVSEFLFAICFIGA